MNFNQLLSDYLSFVRKPDLSGMVASKPYKMVRTFQLWLITFLVVIISSSLIDEVFDLPMHDAFDQIIKQFGFALFFVFAVVIGPFLEEVIFRLPMRFRLKYIIIGFVLLLLYCTFSIVEVLRDISIIKGSAIGAIFFTILLLGIYLITRFKEQIAKCWHQNFRYVFYGYSILFGFVHIFNFEEVSLQLLLLSPLITLPQLLLGFGMGYVRIRFGFWYGYLFHALNNGFAFTVFYFGMKYFPDM